MLFRKLKLDWAYGISELIIVVAGVLIALAADGVRERSADRDLEREYLRRLSSDLMLDTAALSDLMRLTRDRIGYAESVVDVFDTGRFEGSPEDLARAVEFAMWFAYPDYSRETMDDLMSTGNLRLIRDSEIRSALARYYSEIDWRSQFSDNWREVQRSLEAVMPALLEVEHRRALSREGVGGPPWAPEDLQVTERAAAQVIERLLARPEVRSPFANMIRIQDAHYTGLGTIRSLGSLALLELDRYASTLE